MESVMVDFLEGGKGYEARPGIGRWDIERPQLIWVEWMRKGLVVREAQGGQLGIRVSLCCGKEILPSIETQTVEAAE